MKLGIFVAKTNTVGAVCHLSTKTSHKKERHTKVGAPLFDYLNLTEYVIRDRFQSIISKNMVCFEIRKPTSFMKLISDKTPLRDKI